MGCRIRWPVTRVNFQPAGYPEEHPIIPHGLSVILNAPAVFRYTAVANPGRHIEVARLMGADVEGVDDEDAGEMSWQTRSFDYCRIWKCRMVCLVSVTAIRISTRSLLERCRSIGLRSWHLGRLVRKI